MLEIKKDQLDYYILKEKHREIDLDKKLDYLIHLAEWDFYHLKKRPKIGQFFFI